MDHWRKWLMAVLGGLALAAALALVAPADLLGREAPAVAQVTIYVDADATGANDGSSWENAYTTLQPALEDATADDEIWVAAGTYKPSYESTPGSPRTATFQLKNGVALYGGFDPSVGDTEFGDRDWVANATILSGDLGSPGVQTDNSYHVFYHPAALALGASAVLDGFVITGGYANATSPHNRGGGMYNSSSSPTVRHCTFAGNTASSAGGGMNNEVSSPKVIDCTFSDNSASQGGGMANYNSWPRVTDCTFADNSASNGAGGMYNYQSSPDVIGCTFVDNRAPSGAGMYSYTASSPTLTNCTFARNQATSNGGGMTVYTAGKPVVTNCTFSGNSAPNGAGINYVAGASSWLTVTNSILWGDTPQEIAFSGTGHAPAITYSDVQGTSVYPGIGNINEDPQFQDPASGDFDLLADSPCIDAGTNAAPSLPEYDFEGDPRIWDGDFDGTATVDMGADEFAFHTLALDMAGTGSGSVEQTPEGARLAHGTLVTLTATANTGSSFTEWTGDAVGTANPITLTMDADKAVTAMFKTDQTFRIYLPLLLRQAP